MPFFFLRSSFTLFHVWFINAYAPRVDIVFPYARLPFLGLLVAIHFPWVLVRLARFDSRLTIEWIMTLASDCPTRGTRILLAIGASAFAPLGACWPVASGFGFDGWSSFRVDLRLAFYRAPSILSGPDRDRVGMMIRPSMFVTPSLQSPISAAACAHSGRQHLPFNSSKIKIQNAKNVIG